MYIQTHKPTLINKPEPETTIDFSNIAHKKHIMEQVNKEMSQVRTFLEKLSTYESLFLVKNLANSILPEKKPNSKTSDLEIQSTGSGESVENNEIINTYLKLASEFKDLIEKVGRGEYKPKCEGLVINGQELVLSQKEVGLILYTLRPLRKFSLENNIGDYRNDWNRFVRITI